MVFLFLYHQKIVLGYTPNIAPAAGVSSEMYQGTLFKAPVVKNRIRVD